MSTENITDNLNITICLDWDQLREQQQWLLTCDNDNALGILGIINHLQDVAVATGQATEEMVFGAD